MSRVKIRCSSVTQVICVCVDIVVNVGREEVVGTVRAGWLGPADVACA